MTPFLIDQYLAMLLKHMRRHPTTTQKEMPQHHRTTPRPIIMVIASALSLSNPALNNLQPSGGGGQNNTNPTNQETTKSVPGLTQLNPGGQNNPSPPTNNTSGPVKIIKLPSGRVQSNWEPHE